MINPGGVTKFRRHKSTGQRVNYFQTECLDCELILSIWWEREYVGILPRSPPVKTRFKICPFCEGSRIKVSQISEIEYKNINQQWSMVDNAEKSRDDRDDWLSWLR